MGCVHSGVHTDCEAVQHRADLLPQNYGLWKTDLDLSWRKAAESPGKITDVLPKLVISAAATYMGRHVMKTHLLFFWLKEKEQVGTCAGDLYGSSWSSQWDC